MKTRSDRYNEKRSKEGRATREQQVKKYNNKHKRRIERWWKQGRYQNIREAQEDVQKSLIGG